MRERRPRLRNPGTHLNRAIGGPQQARLTFGVAVDLVICRSASYLIGVDVACDGYWAAQASFVPF